MARKQTSMAAAGLIQKHAIHACMIALYDAGSGAAEEDGRDVGEEVEEAVGLLLTGLQDKDTVVRWSAAKGVGRLCSCLPSVSSFPYA